MAMKREPAQPLRLDYLIKAGAVHSMTGETYRCLGLRGPEIVAVSADLDGLDDLVGAETAVVDAGDLTVMPAFADSHEHLIEASRNTLLVPVDKARSVAAFTGMVAAAAQVAAAGKWIVTSIGWHESNLSENRLPTLAELDAAAPDHPVLARRGGHLAVVNSAALRAAGITADTPDPLGGTIGRLADGSRDGVLEGGAVYQVAAFAPGPGQAELAAALGTGSAAYAALGVGTIREAMTTLDDLLTYQEAREKGFLSVRVRPMMRVGSDQTADQAIALISGLGARSGFDDDWLRIWGLKMVLDGGVEGAALEQPYANDPANFGHLNWDPPALTRVCTEAVRRGWKIGTHAVGDRAVRTLLDVYEAVLAQTGAPAAVDADHRACPAGRCRRARARGTRRLRHYRPARDPVEHGQRDAARLGPGPHRPGQPAGRVARPRREPGRRERPRAALQPDDQRVGDGHPGHQGSRHSRP
jgi:predicted amidohydrolase YtcJ